MRIVSLVLGLVLAAAGKAQASATYTYFGYDCSTGVPAFSNLSLPRIGTKLQIRTTASWYDTLYDVGDVLLVTGLSKTSWGGTPLPFDTGVFRSGRIWYCGYVNVSAEVVQLMPYLGRTVPIVVDFPIPNLPSLIGATFHQQVIERHSIRWGYTTWRLTRGATARIGI